MTNNRKKIIVIDDEQINLMLLKNILEPLYEVYTFNNFNTFIKDADQVNPDLILLDIVMPIVDGYTAIKTIKSKPQFINIPIIFLTSKTDYMEEEKGIKCGAVDYITKPFLPEILKARINTHINIKNMQSMLFEQNERLLEEVEKRIQDFSIMHEMVLGVLAHAVEKRDFETGNHIVRTRTYVRIIAEEMSENSEYKGVLSPSWINDLPKASILHDVGKVAIPDYILSKNGKLTDQEWLIMRRHCLYGKQVIQEAVNLIDMDNGLLMNNKSEVLEFFKIATEIAYGHHEKWDGTGYPEGLLGKEIPLSARIMAVADVFDALTSKRSYKDAWSFDHAITEIINQKGRHFDPLIVDIFVKKIDAIKEVFYMYSDKTR